MRRASRKFRDGMRANYAACGSERIVRTGLRAAIWAFTMPPEEGITETLDPDRRVHSRFRAR